MGTRRPSRHHRTRRVRFSLPTRSRPPLTTMAAFAIRLSTDLRVFTFGSRPMAWRCSSRCGMRTPGYRRQPNPSPMTRAVAVSCSSMPWPSAGAANDLRPAEERSCGRWWHPDVDRLSRDAARPKPRFGQRRPARSVNSCWSGTAVAGRDNKGAAPASRPDQPVLRQAGKCAAHRIPADAVVLGKGHLSL